MKLAILYLIILFNCFGIFSQNTQIFDDARPENNVSLNLLGDASLISVNYEKIYFLKSTFILGSKLGLGYNKDFQICLFQPCTTSEDIYLTIPHHITGNIGRGRHFFEFGIGGTFLNGRRNKFYLWYPLIGYRIQPIKSKAFYFRLFASYPLSSLEGKDFIVSPLGINLGSSF